MLDSRIFSGKVIPGKIERYPVEKTSICTKPRWGNFDFLWHHEESQSYMGRENKIFNISQKSKKVEIKQAHQINNLFNKTEMSEKIRPSLISSWRAELEDLSLLEGRELAARELVACSCIASTTSRNTEIDRERSNFLRLLERQKSGTLMLRHVNHTECVQRDSSH
jgi:hypothetical protein